MRYAEYAPSPRLAAIADCFWILEGDGAGVPEPIIPDGRVEIVIHFGVRFHQHYVDGRVERQPASMIVGQCRHDRISSPWRPRRGSLSPASAGVHARRSSWDANLRYRSLATPQEVFL